MAMLHAKALRSHTGQLPWRQAAGSGDTDALQRQQLLLLRGSIVTASRPPATSPTRASEMHSSQCTWTRGVRAGAGVEELLHMKRLLAEKLGEQRPSSEEAIPGLRMSKTAARTASDIEEAKTIPGLLLSKTVPRTLCNFEEDSGCSWSSPTSRSMSSSPQESPRPVARVLMKDGLAYVVR